MNKSWSNALILLVHAGFVLETINKKRMIPFHFSLD